MAKEKWEPMEIARVKLNPEQAVLTCCDSSSKSQQYPEDTTWDWRQCHSGEYACQGAGGEAPSS